MITEAEAPVPGGDPAENALRCRRLAFYERCGFRPVYEIGACGARFQALVLGTPPEGRAELAAAHGIREIDLLPFHRLGESKYAVIQQPYTMPDATVPQEHIDALAALLRQRGFIVSIGG